MVIKTSDGSYMGETVVRQICLLCNKMSSVTVPTVALDKWHKGMKIQDAWPESTAGQRETLISGSHESCFDDTFAEEDGQMVEILGEDDK